MKILLTNTAETEKLGVNIANRILVRPEWGKNIFLFGNIGAGKTSFVQGLAEGLGILHPIQSPTFALISHHKIPHNRSGIETLAHMDMYRLENPNTVNMLEIYDEINEKSSITAIEWSENFPKEMLPKTRIEVHISRNTNASLREATVNFFSSSLPSDMEIRTFLEEKEFSLKEKEEIAAITKKGERIAQNLIKKGRALDIHLVRCGCLLHNASRKSADKTVELLYKKNFTILAESLSYIFSYSKGKPLLLEEQCILAGILLQKNKEGLDDIARDIIDPLLFQAGITE